MSEVIQESDELRALAEARVGRTVADKFRLQRLIGFGGMGAVYEAEHRNRKRVALKLLHPGLAASALHRKRFVREAYLANAIEHHGVVQIHDDGEDDELGAYLVMELLEGESVGAYQRRHGGVIALPALMQIADQLLDVLAVAHARGVVHRDIKPDNLFITTRGHIKVLDFGIARLFEQEQSVAPSTQVHTPVTQAGALLGTPAFMAQEQARGLWSQVDARSDLWSVGATMFSLISGQHVHCGETPNEQLGRAMTVAARSLADVARDVPHALVTVLDRALRFDPAERWPDARAMQNALREAWSGQSWAPAEVKAVRTGAALTLPAGVESPRANATSSWSALKRRAARLIAAPRARTRMLVVLATMVVIATLASLSLRKAPPALPAAASSSDTRPAISAAIDVAARKSSVTGAEAVVDGNIAPEPSSQRSLPAVNAIPEPSLRTKPAVQSGAASTERAQVRRISRRRSLASDALPAANDPLDRRR